MGISWFGSSGCIASLVVVVVVVDGIVVVAEGFSDGDHCVSSKLDGSVDSHLVSTFLRFLGIMARQRCPEGFHDGW